MELGGDDDAATGGVKNVAATRGAPIFPRKGGGCILHGAERHLYTCSCNGCTHEAQKGGVCASHGTTKKRCSHEGCTSFARLAGNVADMSRHVGDDTTCRSNFGQMGPCCRHKIEDVVAVCVGSSRHLPDFPKCVCRNILWYRSTYAQILSTLISVVFSILSCSPVCHVLAGDNAHPHNTDKREYSQKLNHTLD